MSYGKVEPYQYMTVEGFFGKQPQTPIQTRYRACIAAIIHCGQNCLIQFVPKIDEKLSLIQNVFLVGTVNNENNKLIYVDVYLQNDTAN